MKRSDGSSTQPQTLLCLALSLLLLLAGCATRPLNPPITHVDLNAGYRFVTRPQYSANNEDLVILAFSGGGTRAAAFSYGVLEFLRNTTVVGPNGGRSRLLDRVGVITGVSGGSFTALAYGLYGDRLFDDYEQRFLKRNVQGEIISRSLNPIYWSSLASRGWGRSELAADLYDQILFGGATFADLNRGAGPFIVVSATDISTGSSLPFNQFTFDLLCSDLGAVRLSRAAAASSAVPVVLSPVTLNNYGGTCDYTPPSWARAIVDSVNTPRSAARAMRRAQERMELEDSVNRPYIHLVDGGVSDNLGMLGVLDTLELMDLLYSTGQPSPLDHIKRIIVFIVNAVSSPKTDWDKKETPPGTLQILLKAATVPIDRYSYEATERLLDIQSRWRTIRRLRESPTFTTAKKDRKSGEALRTPEAKIYAIDVSFAQLIDPAERDYLNQLPTSLSLPAEAVDRLRAAAGQIIIESPEFQRLLKDVGGSIVVAPSQAAASKATPVGK